jgi:SAM-dependent methyltransferase
MEDELNVKLRAYYGADPTPIELKHLDFAMSNRRRGSKVINKVVARTGIDLRGKRVLDVGSAYGGFVIEAAARGAEAWGVEIGRRLHEYGLLNARGEPGDIHQVHANFLSPRVLDELPRDFDLVLVNDVFEHIYDTAALLKQLHALMRPGAAFMFAIPNGDAVKHLEREGHNGTPGLTLLPPNYWHRVVDHYTCFYHPWSYYAGLFRAFGFERIDTWSSRRLGVDDTRAEIAAGVVRAKAAIATLKLDDTTREVLEANLADYETRLARDLAAGDAAHLTWRYLTTFWSGCAFKGGAVTADVDEHPTPRAAGAAERLSTGVRGMALRARDAVALWKRRGVSLPRAFAPPPPAVVMQPRALAPVSLDVPAAELTSHWSRRTQTSVTPTGTGLRCDVVAGGDSGPGNYGGVRLPIAQPGRLRLDLELVGIEHIESVYIDGEDVRRRRRVRWRWAHPSPSRAARAVFELEAGVDGTTFLAAAPTEPAEATELHIFIRVAAGQRAAFVLHGIEVGG